MANITDHALARQTNDLDAFWLPFTPNRAFKRAPRLIARAKGMHYFTPDGRAVVRQRGP
jgi:beta-alanine--pyruvate transaminase